MTNRKSHMSFRLVLKSVTLNDLERRNGRYIALFRWIWQTCVPTHNRVDLCRNLCTSFLYFVVGVRCRRKESSRSLSHLLMSFLYFVRRSDVYSNSWLGKLRYISSTCGVRWFHKSTKSAIIDIKRRRRKEEALGTAATQRGHNCRWPPALYANYLRIARLTFKAAAARRNWWPSRQETSVMYSVRPNSNDYDIIVTVGVTLLPAQRRLLFCRLFNVQTGKVGAAARWIASENADIY